MPGRTSINGTVKDAVTHHTLPQVVVMIEAREGGYSTQAETDSNGRFSVQGVGGGQFIVRVRLPGYEESSQEINMDTDPMAYLTFELKPRPGSGPPAVAPEGPDAKLNARLASVPDKAKKEFVKARELWQEGKDIQGCVDHLNKAIKDYPKFADAYVLLASADMQLKNPADAKAALAKAIEVDPKLADARFTLGKIQVFEKDFPNAEKTLTEALKLDDSSAEGHYELARAYFGLKRWDDAEPHVQKAITLMPALAPAHILAGDLALRKNDADGALKEFREYLKLDPNGPMAQGAQDMIKKIQDAIGPQAQQ
ncbi:MAG TPA: tetratricopeptide repeat protein [Terriglobales bacterium]